MNNEVIILDLGQEWDFECRFFVNLKRGVFDVNLLRH